MRKLPAIVPLVFLIAAVPFISLAQEQQSWEVGALNKILPGTSVGSVFFENGVWHGTNGVYVTRGDTTLTADSASVNLQTGETVADGNVRIEQGAEIWLGEHITYNFKTHQMRSEEFRTGKAPVFAAGNELQGNSSNKVYNVRHAFVTTDDVSDPAIRIRASHVKIVPGQYIEAWNAVLYLDGVSAFYFPYYKRVLGERANNFNFLAGYRSIYGPYLLNTYSYYIGDAADGKIHLDYREKRGVGAGPDLNLHLGQWGNATFSYYYLHDHDPNESININNF